MKHPIIITGHTNPDSDSICAALAYADLKTQLGFNVLPIRLGNINSETAYILNRWNVEPPKLMHKLETKIKDISMDFDSTYSYMVDFVYSKDGVISGIVVKHNEKDKYTFTPDEN